MIIVCPYLESSFEILRKEMEWPYYPLFITLPKWYGSFFRNEARSTDITPRALSLKWSPELGEHQLIKKKVEGESPVVISYELTEKGQSLAAALQPIQEWALKYQQITIEKGEEK